MIIVVVVEPRGSRRKRSIIFSVASLRKKVLNYIDYIIKSLELLAS